MTKETLLNNLFQWGALAALVAVAMPDLAFAQAGVGQALVDVRQNELPSVITTINAVSFIGGAVLGISGVLKLKQHAENPSQNKMAQGIAHLMAGGGLALLPTLLGTLQNTTHLQSNATFNGIANTFQ